MVGAKRTNNWLMVAVVGAALVVMGPAWGVAADDPETLLEQSLARAAELEGPSSNVPTPHIFGAPVDYPLFIGVDDVTITQQLGDPATATWVDAFVGAEVWGSAYDPDNDKIYFNDGSTLYEWPIGGATNMLGTITDPTGATLSMVGLAFYGGTLYGTRNVANEAVYAIDTTTLVATVFIDYVDADYDFGGFAADPNTGTFYGTSDDSTPGRGLYQINLDGTATLIADYPDAQTDIDGLAVGDNGVAYLVIDQPGFIYPYDLVGGAYLPFFNNPWTTSEVFSGGAWITDAVAGPAISLTKTVGTTPAVCAPTDTITVGFGTEVTYCYTVENIGDTTLEFHDLEDDQLGTLLTDFPFTLVPGGTAEVLATATITAPVTNTGTWTAADALPGYAFDDTVPFQFVDISGTGTALGLTDDGEADVTMPFDFTFYGTTSDQVCIGNNGAMLFGQTGCSISFSNGALPSSSVPMGILPFWDDMDDETGDVYYETQGTAPNRVFIVEWFDRPHFNGVGTATFEVILYEGTNEILFQYEDVDFGDPAFDLGASATVGLNMDAATANQYSFNSPVLDNGLAILWASSNPIEVSDQDTATVNLEDPDIDVTPASLASSLLVGTMETQQLTIANLGSATLDWNLEEAMPSAARFPQMPNPTGLGDEAVAEERPDAAVPPLNFQPNAPVDWTRPQVILYDNGPLVTCPGCGSGGADESELQTGLGMNTLGFGHQQTAGNRIADDFTIADASGWTVETITFFAYQTGSGPPSTMTGLTLQIWDGPPDAGGSVIWGDTTTNVMTSTAWPNLYRVTDTTSGTTNRPIMASTATVNTFLPQGTYWLDWATDGSGASGPWAPPISIIGQTTTGNGLQWTGTWAPANDSGTLTQQGFPFIIEGTSSTCYTPSDIPWLSADPTTGSIPAAGNTPVDVTFDATVVPVGNYDALLCVFSNDPDEPLVEVPVSMEVVIPVELMSIDIE